MGKRKKSTKMIGHNTNMLHPTSEKAIVHNSKIKNNAKTPKRNERNPLIPLTPRIALSVADVSKYKLTTRDNLRSCYLPLQESIYEEPEPFMPSESEYHPSDSDSGSESGIISDPDVNNGAKNVDVNIPDITNTAGDDVEKLGTLRLAGNIESNANTNPHQIINPASQKKWTSRYHFCPFCKERVTRFARHVLNVHKTEPEVIEINVLPPNNLERSEKIAALRKKGMFEYNTCTDQNKGDIIVNRRPKIQNNKNVNNLYIPCKNCKGFYRSSNIPKHYKACSGQSSARGIIRCGRMLSRKVLPRYFEYIESIIKNGRHDNLEKIILNDEAILYYGAKLASRYMHVKHMDNHIRANMRLLARLLVCLKRVDPSIQCLTDGFKSSKMENMMIAARDVCDYNQEKRCFQNPSAALHLSGIILKCCEALIVHYIQTGDEIMKQQIDNFKCLVNIEFCDMVRMGHANLIQNKLSSAVPLPLAADICKLNSYLRNTGEAACARLNTEPFSFNLWHELTSCTLILLLIFNRRRTGETERLTLNNYNARSSIAKGTDIYESLEQHEKLLCNNFYRLEIRGKWGRSVPLLLTKNLVTYINTIIDLREKAGVGVDNPYVFGVGASSHLFAGKILREVSRRCGASNPNSLRATNLRKQIATVTQIIDMSDGDIKLLSQFMGHSQLVHEQSYRKTDSTLQIARLSRLLMAFNEGQLNRYKGCSLDQLDIDMENDGLVTLPETNSTPSSVNMISEYPINNDAVEGNTKYNTSPADASTGSSMKDSSIYNEPENITPSKQGIQTARRNKCCRNLFQATKAVNSLCTSTGYSTPRKRKIMKKGFLSPGLESNHEIVKNQQRTFASKIKWSTPERQTIRRLFLSELKRGVLPSFSECTRASLNEPTLRRRSAKTIYACINNLNKKIKKIEKR